MKVHAARRRAMTAIEVLVATLLASLLLAAVAGLLGALTRQERELRDRGDVSPWRQQLSEQLLWDLRNARRFAVVPGGIWLDGYGARDFVTLRPTGEPASIRYSLIEAAGERWLVRLESHFTLRTNSPPRVDLVFRGVQRFQCGGVTVDSFEAAGAMRPSDDQFQNIPDRVNLQLFASDLVQPVFGQVFCIR